jgi:CO/xanthine dehydrogenase Mo-binding subunit
MATVCGQVFEEGVGIGACFEALRVHWNEALDEMKNFNTASQELRRGVGLAAGWYGCGNTSLPNPSTIKSGVLANGKIVLHQGAMDIGQGANTVITQIFAEALGADVYEIELVGADTDLTPDAGKTSASRQTFVSGNAARLSGLALRAEILRLCNLDSAVAQISVGDGFITVADGSALNRISLSDLPADEDGYVLRAEKSYDPPTKPLDQNGQGVPYAQFGYAAHLAVVDVDMRLGTVTAVRLVAAHDVGRAINPMLVEGQVHGGIAQGLGMALMEEYIPGRTENLHDYLIPTIGDIPPIETVIVEESDAHGPYGAKGLGEHVLIPTAPALINAINRAADVQIRQVPVTPARLRAKILESQND